MKVLLLNPPSPEGTQYVRVERCMQKKSAWAGSLWQPLPLMYAQSVLEKAGHETKLKDAVAEGMGYGEALAFVKGERPDVLVVNTSVPTVNADCGFAVDAKKVVSGMRTVAIGVPVDILPSIIAEAGFDYGSSGDVEASITDIVEGGAAGSGKSGRTVFVKRWAGDLDAIPFPSLRDLDLDKYQVPFTREKLMLVDTGRGCPFKCSFCLVPATGEGKVRFRSGANVVDELERDCKEYGIRNFLFWNENSTLNREAMRSICDEITGRGLEIKWMTPSRVDTVDEELLGGMKKAGCHMLSFGIESVDQAVLDGTCKSVTVAQIDKAIDMTRKAGIDVMAHIIIGLPGQTKESVERTLEWLMDKDIEYAQFYCAVPYWKTGIRRTAEQKGWLESDRPEDYEIDNAVMRNEYLSTEDIEKLRRDAFARFYFRPKVVLRELVACRFNPIYAANLAKDGLYFFKAWVSAKSK